MAVTYADLSILKVNPDVLRDLDCPVCMEMFIPPIFNCTGGHSVCSDCRSKLVNCPTCRNFFHGGRNYSLEKIIMGCQKQCKFFDQGCTKILKMDLHKSHVKFCHYRELTCSCCAQNGIKYKELVKHLEDKHNDLVSMLNFKTPFTPNNFALDYTLSRDLVSRTAPRQQWQPTWFKFSNDVAIFIQPQLRDGILFFSLWKYPHDSVDLICNMKLCFDQVPTPSASWNIKINAYGATLEENIVNGTVAIIAPGIVFSNTEVDPVDNMHHFKIKHEIKEDQE